MLTLNIKMNKKCDSATVTMTVVGTCCATLSISGKNNNTPVFDSEKHIVVYERGKKSKSQVQAARQVVLTQMTTLHNNVEQRNILQCVYS